MEFRQKYIFDIFHFLGLFYVQQIHFLLSKIPSGFCSYIFIGKGMAFLAGLARRRFWRGEAEFSEKI